MRFVTVFISLHSRQFPSWPPGEKKSPPRQTWQEEGLLWQWADARKLDNAHFYLKCCPSLAGRWFPYILADKFKSTQRRKGGGRDGAHRAGFFFRPSCLWFANSSKKSLWTGAHSLELDKRQKAGGRCGLAAQIACHCHLKNCILSWNSNVLEGTGKLHQGQTKEGKFKVPGKYLKLLRSMHRDLQKAEDIEGCVLKVLFICGTV